MKSCFVLKEMGSFSISTTICRNTLTRWIIESEIFVILVLILNGKTACFSVSKLDQAPSTIQMGQFASGKEKINLVLDYKEKIMHNLHFFAVNAESAEEAAATVEDSISDFGNADNWRCIGGVASASGNNDIICVDDSSRWSLNFLDDAEGQTYFEKAINYTKKCIKESLGENPNIKIKEIADKLVEKPLEINAEANYFGLWSLARDLEELGAALTANAKLLAGNKFPSYNYWELDKFGFTDDTDDSDDEQFIVMIDMHS